MMERKAGFWRYGFAALMGGVLFACAACQHRGTGGSGGTVSFGDFLEKFPGRTVPFVWTADSLEKHFPDSLRLDPKVWKRYLTDSLLRPAQVRLFPVGKTTYHKLRVLFLEGVSGQGRRVHLLVYGKADTLINTLEVASTDPRAPGQVFSLRFDEQYLVHINERKALAGGQVILRERVYGLNDDGSLALIMTNTNQPASAGSYYNPIDTLPRTHSYSGDYLAGSSDLVSIRDGEHPGECRFFIHLDKGHGDCTGEVEGVARFTGKSTAVFSDKDGPCAIHFTFQSGAVVIAEAGGCGAYRGVGCYFDGKYRKKAASPGKKK